MNWYKQAITKKRRETIAGTIFAITSTLALLLWHFVLGKTFTWTNIQPISNIYEYTFYSALVFIGPGAYLRYHTTFYLDLWHFFRRTLHQPGLHKDVKKVIWIFMTLVVFGAVIAIFWLLNAIISFIYNILALLLCLSPPIGAGLIVGMVTYLFLKKDSAASIFTKE